jgi:hypothetical protein
MLATIAYETRGLAFNKLVVMKEDDGDIKKGAPIILAKDVNERCCPRTRRLLITSHKTRIKRL